MTSYAAEVIADNSGKWVGNQLRFATEQEAQAYVRDLEWRWTLVRQTRVVASDDPVTDKWVDGMLLRIDEPVPTGPVISLAIQPSES